MTITVSTKGQIVLPAGIRRQDGIKPGQKFEVERIDLGEYRLKRTQSPANEGVVDWLLRCPEKGCLRLMDDRETTDSVKLTSFK